MIDQEPNEPQQMPLLPIPMPEDAPQRVQSSDHQQEQGELLEGFHRGG